MAPDVNARIKRTISQGDFDPKVKDFLLKMLDYELENFSSTRWWYMDVYEKEIDQVLGSTEEEGDKQPG
jgi:hypothetical protein